MTGPTDLRRLDRPSVLHVSDAIGSVAIVARCADAGDSGTTGGFTATLQVAIPGYA